MQTPKGATGSTAGATPKIDRYRVLSVEGHIVEASFSFTVRADR